MSVQNCASNEAFVNLPVYRGMNVKHWHGIKNCQGKSEVLGVTPIPVTPIPVTHIPVTPIPMTPIPVTPIPVTSIPMTLFLLRGTIRDLRDLKPTLILTT
jgi:hypothetical protein